MGVVENTGNALVYQSVQGATCFLEDVNVGPRHDFAPLFWEAVWRENRGRRHFEICNEDVERK